MAAVGAFFTAVWTGTSAAGAVGAALLKAAVGLALNIAVSKILAPKGPRPQELQTELRSSNAQRVRHLGRVRTSGAVMFWEWAHVSGQRRLFKLLAVADGGMTNVVQWYLDGEPVDVDAEGYVTTEPWNKGKVRLRWRKGVQGDQWDGGDYADLRAAFPSHWTINHRLRGVGTILATFDAVDGEDIAEVYSGGEPEVSALIDGADPYWAVSGQTMYSRNPAVHLSDILSNPTYGVVSDADLDLTRFAAALSDCNANVPTAGGTRPRYRSGVSYALSDALKDVAQKILDAMGGRAWITPEGKVAVEAGVWRAPTVTIEERHIVEMEYGAGTERIKRVTTLVPTYVAPEVRWQETTADPVDDAAAIARWGEGDPKGVDLLAVQHHGQAAHICKQMLARMNPARRMTIKLRSFGLRLIGERAVAVNLPRLGLSSTPFWIESLNFDGTNTTVELIEADPASFSWTAAEEGDPPEEAQSIDRGAATNTMSIDSVTVVTTDGDPYIRITGSYNAEPALAPFAQYRRSDQAGTFIWTDMIREEMVGGFSFRTPPLRDLTEYDVRASLSPPVPGGKVKPVIPYLEVTGIEVVANGTAPAEPVIVSSSGAAGGTLAVTFEPDLGANYHRTGLYRAAAGASFGTATLIKWSYDTSAQVTMSAAIPSAGARFWLRSENQSQVKSDPVEVGDYPA
ncbi:hypothetical protein [Paracoccus kondratievae]|uniref:Tip attachment protein J domain-containing protein n=1 Tax=Paracoccus kondratievae TaxID=135740 RepID=A0AAD3RU74_9RHOB|nr:hypothetical protein [Paracoccus kondratievae]GLK65278.1 hypothetical protein GCM10017635_27520 [Paracoccus kondratievae]